MGQAGSGPKAGTETRRLRPDLVLMDLKMHLTVVEVRPEGRRMFVGTVRDVSARVEAESERGRLEAQLL